MPSMLMGRWVILSTYRQEYILVIGDKVHGPPSVVKALTISGEVYVLSVVRYIIGEYH